MRSACSCCSADNAALASSTPPTRAASSGEPSIALATAPVASSGVIGFRQVGTHLTYEIVGEVPGGGGQIPQTANRLPVLPPRG